MKHYNAQFIKNYIETNADKISIVDCGMKEDWSWTSETIFENGQFYPDIRFDVAHNTLKIAGISGSTWATPVMEVMFNDGHSEIVECWNDDGEIASEEPIARAKAFAVTTGGGDVLQ